MEKWECRLRGELPVTLHRPTNRSADLQAWKDVFFLCCGKLAAVPGRYVSQEELWDDMEAIFVYQLSSKEKLLYSLENKLWARLRDTVSSQLYYVTTRKSVVQTPKEIKAEYSRLRKRVIRQTLAEASERMTRAVVVLQPRLGRSLSMMLYKASSLVKGEKGRSSYVRIMGQPSKAFDYNPHTYREAMAAQAATPWTTYAIPGSPPPLVIGSHTAERECVLTVSGVPSELKELDFRTLLEHAAMESSSLVTEIQCATLVRTKQSVRTGQFSWKVALSSLEVAQLAMAHLGVLRGTDSRQRAFQTRSYHHIFDLDVDWAGLSANVQELLSSLLSSSSVALGGGEVGATPLLAVIVWEDGIAASFGHLVCGLVRIVGVHQSTFGRLYTMRGSDSSSTMMNILVCQIPLMAKPAGPISTVVLLLDHLLAFERTGVKAGNQGFRNPFVAIQTEQQGCCFIGPARSIATLSKNATTLFAAFEMLSTSGADECDFTSADLKRVLRAFKRSQSVMGVVDMPSVMQCSARDPWSDWRNLAALELWQRAASIKFDDAALSKSIVLNMRMTVELSASSGRLSLKGLLAPNVQFELVDEFGQLVLMDGLVSVAPIAPASRLFLRHFHKVDDERIVLFPPSLHCWMFVIGLLTDQLNATLVAGGDVLGVSTMGYSKKEMQNLASKLRQMILGRGYLVHSYCSLSGQTPIFSRWLEVAGAITCPALKPLVVFAASSLKTRVSKDVSLKKDLQRYLCYLLHIAIVPTLLCVELGELAQRQGDETATKEYLLVRSANGASRKNISMPLNENFSLNLREEEEVAMSLGVAAADEEEAESAREQRVSEVVAAAERREKRAKFDKIKIASLCCGVPQAMYALLRTMDTPPLLGHYTEDEQEKRLKITKATSRGGNQRHHLYEGIQAGDNAADDVERARLEETMSADPELGVGRWDGAGLAMIIVGRCWLERLWLGRYNLLGAVRDLNSAIGLDRLAKVVKVVLTPGAGELAAVSFRVGTEWDSVAHQYLCACGNDAHLKAYARQNCWRTLDQAALDALLALQPPLPEVREQPVPMSDVIGKAKARKKKREAIESQEAKERAVFMLLKSLGFDGDVLSATMLNAFRSRQHAYQFLNRPWPKKKADQIDWLFRYKDDDGGFGPGPNHE